MAELGMMLILGCGDYCVWLEIRDLVKCSSSRLGGKKWAEGSGRPSLKRGKGKKNSCEYISVMMAVTSEIIRGVQY